MSTSNKGFRVARFVAILGKLDRLSDMAKWPGDGTKEVTTFGGLTRSEVMRRIRSSGNKTTELRMLKLLRCFGITGWRRHSSLPGKPDFSWPKEHLALFVDGCFWHGHNCRTLTSQTNQSSWNTKIRKTKARDQRVNRLLRAKGWSVVRVWECDLQRRKAWIASRISRALARMKKRVKREEMDQKKGTH